MDELERRLAIVSSRIQLVERFISAFAHSLGEPLYYHSGKIHAGYRYAAPDERHFALLKAVRAASSLNAAVALAKGGFTQEVGVLMRVLVECTTSIDFVLFGRSHSGALRPEAKTYIEEYFSDFARNSPADFRKPKLAQKSMHKSVGEQLDAHASLPQSTQELLSNIYLTYSNYVHCKYPEVMDLFGGDPGKFHTNGMRQTPKELENAEILETQIDTVEISMKLIAVTFNTRAIFGADSTLADWYRSIK